MSELHLRYRDLSIAVSSDHPADLIWLEDFLGPSYQRRETPAEAMACRVGLHGALTWTTLTQAWQRQEAAGNLGKVLAHVLDGSDLHLPCHRRNDGTILAW